MGYLMPAIGGAADIGGLITGIKNQNQQSQQLTNTGNAMQGYLNQVGGEGSRLYGNYAANAQPALNSIIGSAPGQAAQYQGSAAGAYGNAQGYGGALAGSPYPGMIQSEGGLFQSLPAASIAGEYGNVAQLENWHGLQPKELGQATSVASDAAMSAANMFKQNAGGVPNAGLAYEEGVSNAAQTGMQTALGLGSMAEQQELGAKEAAGQELGAIAGQQLSQAAGTVGATEAAGQQYSSNLGEAGQLSLGAGQGYAGLSGQDLQELESAIGTEASLAGTGMGAQEYGASDYTSLMESELGYEQGQQNPYSTFGNSIMSLLSMFG